jgi:Bacterial TSP3 repeat
MTRPLVSLAPALALLMPALALAWCVGGAPPARDGDGDGLNDIQETFFGTDPGLADTDGDGTPDGAEDADADGIANQDEGNLFSIEAFADPFAGGRRFSLVLEGTRLFEGGVHRVTVVFPDNGRYRRVRLGSRFQSRTRLYLRLSRRLADRLLGATRDGQVRVVTANGDTNVLHPVPMHCDPELPMLMGAAVVELRTPVAPAPLRYVVIGGCNLLDREPQRVASTRVRVGGHDIVIRAPYGGAAMLPARILVPMHSLALPDPLRPPAADVAVGDPVQVVTSAGASNTVVVEPPIAQLRIPPADVDEDHDGDRLTSLAELALGTDPLVWDTDGDGLSDGAEVVRMRTDPLDPDTDGDGVLDR